MKKSIVLAMLVVSSFVLAQSNKVGINTTTPTSVLDVNGDLRVRTIPTSSNIKDVALVTDVDGNVKKKLNEVRGLMRAYLASNFPAGSSSSNIYKIGNSWTMIENPNSDFSTTNSLFTAPSTGLYRIVITITAKAAATATRRSAPTFVYGLVNNSNNQWVLRFSVESSNIFAMGTEEFNTAGVTYTFQGVAQLTAGTSYYFGATGNQTILYYPSGNTGSGTGTYFEIQQI